MISLSFGCATILEGPAQKIKIHCEPSADVNIVVDGSEVSFQNGIINLDKKRDTHFVTFEKPGYNTMTMSFSRDINPLWVTADFIWLYFAPVAWFVDWQNGSIFEIGPKDIHVVLRKKERGNQ